jgi:cell division protein FtsL
MENQRAETSKSQRPVINYYWILKHLPFFLFLSLLAIIYIANGHWADTMLRDISKTSKEVKEKEYEYKSLKSIEMYKSRESQVTQAAAPLGLKPAIEPPVTIEAK